MPYTPQRRSYFELEGMLREVIELVLANPFDPTTLELGFKRNYSILDDAEFCSFSDIYRNADFVDEWIRDADIRDRDIAYHEAHTAKLRDILAGLRQK